MTKFLAVAALMLMTGFATVSAQDGPKGGTMPQRMVAELAPAIPDLTDAQKESITAYVESQMDKMRPAEGEQFDPEGMKAKMEEMQKGMDEEMKSILTDEQYKAYEAWKEENAKKGPMGGHPGGPGQGGPGQGGPGAH